MWRITSHFLLFLILCIGPCNAAEQLQGQQRIDDFTFNGIVVSPKASEGDVIEQLGSPIKKTIHSIQNLYYDFDDKLTSYDYPGLAIEFYQFAHPKHGWTKLVRVSVKDARWPLKAGLTLGLPSDSVRITLGPPHRTLTEEGRLQWHYFPSNDESHLQIICIFEDKILTEVVWSNIP